MEAKEHEQSAFVTLTYRNEELPDDNSLCPQDYQLYLKRLRKSGRVFRYVLVGEYGERKGRPHYHALFFGLSPDDKEAWDMWPHGSYHVGTVTPDSVTYVAGYCLKKMTSKKDVRLNGRYPEFIRTSRRPGIGARWLDELADDLEGTTAGSYVLAEKGIPGSAVFEGKTYPLDRYSKQRMLWRMGNETDSSKDSRYDLRTLAMVQEFHEVGEERFFAKRRNQVLKRETRFRLFSKKVRDIEEE